MPGTYVFSEFDRVVRRVYSPTPLLLAEPTWILGGGGSLRGAMPKRRPWSKNFRTTLLSPKSLPFFYSTSDGENIGFNVTKPIKHVRCFSAGLFARHFTSSVRLWLFIIRIRLP